MMDNNSGNYQPSDGHFLTLLKRLHDAGATDGSTRVGTHSTVKGFGGRGAFLDYLQDDDYCNKVKDKAKSYSFDMTNLTNAL